MVDATSDQQHREPPPPGLRFVVWWVIANSIGATLGAFLVDALTGGFFYSNFPGESVPVDTLVRIITTGLLLGGIIGLVEWFVVRSYLPRMYWWVLATSIGWAVALSLALFLNANMPLEWTENVVWRTSNDQSLWLGFLDHVVASIVSTSWIKALIMGAVIGLFQAVVLSWHVRYAQFWILTNAFAWAIAAFCVELMYSILDSLRYPLSTFADPLESSQIFSAFILFLLLETGTGLTLLWLLRNRRNQPSRQSLTSEPLSAS